MNYENILLSIEDGIAHLRLNRPAKRNAVNNGLLQDIEAALDGLGADATVVVISGEGAHFSAGSTSPSTRSAPLRGAAALPVVAPGVPQGAVRRPAGGAALHGAVVGGGLELATSTHVRVAGRSTFYQLPEGQRGIFVGGGASVRVSKIIGPDRMTEMMLTGRRYDAEDGYRLGLSHYLVDDAEVLPEAFRLARQIATNAPLSNWASINAVANIGDMSMANGLYTESMAAALAQSSDEANKRMQDFLNRKKG
jgi:enoyl-CoA hydratase/carnithine racemase